MDGAGARDGLEACYLGLAVSGSAEFQVMGRTRFSFIAGLLDPSMTFWAAEVKSTRPAIGRYSWFRVGSFRNISSAWILRFQSVCTAPSLICFDGLK